MTISSLLSIFLKRNYSCIQYTWTGADWEAKRALERALPPSPHREGDRRSSLLTATGQLALFILGRAAHLALERSGLLVCDNSNSLPLALMETCSSGGYFSLSSGLPHGQCSPGGRWQSRPLAHWDFPQWSSQPVCPCISWRFRTGFLLSYLLMKVLWKMMWYYRMRKLYNKYEAMNLCLFSICK